MVRSWLAFFVNPCWRKVSSQSIKRKRWRIEGSILSPIWYLDGLCQQKPLSSSECFEKTTRKSTYRGCTSASKSTVSMPSRARAAAAYDPAGPPPTTRTVHCLGIDILWKVIWLREKAKVRNWIHHMQRTLAGIWEPLWMGTMLYIPLTSQGWSLVKQGLEQYIES